MKLRLRLFIVFFLGLFIQASAQDSWWVFFTDKDGVEFDPYEYFDAKAIERRLKHNIPLKHISDYPLQDKYVNKVGAMVDSISGHSRWFNAIAVRANSLQLEMVKQLPFVQSVAPMDYVAIPAAIQFDTVTKHQRRLIKQQTESLEIEKFHEAGLTGKGVRVAVFDGGFPSVNTHPIFEYIRGRDRIKATWDFTRNKENVYRSIAHGTAVLSCIGGYMNDIPFGLAIDAEFILAKTEVNWEPFSEEKNWMMAVEWADKNGADIINSSLGYTSKRYSPANMDGRHALVSRAANMAARKGILVVNSAGNEGGGSWRIIGAPADADSVLSIGGTRMFSEVHTSFSSFGPTADNRMKPNVCANGHVFAATKRGLGITQGTSFSSPLIAGFAACVMQQHPEWPAMKVFEEIQKAGHLYPYFDYAHGFGVPKASYFTDSLSQHQSELLWEVEKEDDEYVVRILSDSVIDIVEDNQYSSLYLYYKINDKAGKLKKYWVIRVNSKIPLRFDAYEAEEGDRLKIWFLNHIEEVEIKK